MIDLDLFFDFLKDVGMTTNFEENWQNDLHSASWRSETN